MGTSDICRKTVVLVKVKGERILSRVLNHLQHIGVCMSTCYWCWSFCSLLRKENCISESITLQLTNHPVACLHYMQMGNYESTFSVWLASVLPFSAFSLAPYWVWLATTVWSLFKLVPNCTLCPPLWHQTWFCLFLFVFSSVWIYVEDCLTSYLHL